MQRQTQTSNLVIRVLRTTKEPLTLREIWQRIKPICPTVAFSTIFRIIERLVAEKKVSSVDWRERASRYEWAGDHHHHIRCVSCGSVTNILEDLIGLDFDKIASHTNFIIKDHSIEFEGTCANCQLTQKGIK